METFTQTLTFMQYQYDESKKNIDLQTRYFSMFRCNKNEKNFNVKTQTENTTCAQTNVYFIPLSESWLQETSYNFRRPYV